jgi:hypothetical protein
MKQAKAPSQGVTREAFDESTRLAVGWAALHGYDMVGLTDQTLSCAAKAHVPKPERHAACLYVSRAMRAA